MVTAYDFPSAVHVARAGMDLILVGDSLAMVELGHDTTQPVTLDQMLHHCQAVKRGVQQLQNSSSSSNNANSSSGSIPMLIGDMPFGTYEYRDTDIALKHAYRFIKEAGMDAVKLEGGSVARARTVQHLVEGGIAVMGHVGLTPQAISVLGGFRAQGRTASRARQLLDDALRLQDAGAFCIVLECVPSNVADLITKSLEVPTIGIGAGNRTTGQVLVYHDMLGMLSHPHHEQFVPRFCKKYASVGHAIQEGLQEFKMDVEGGRFPGDSEEFSPYKMTSGEQHILDELLSKDNEERQQKHKQAAVKIAAADEYEQLSLYGGSGGGNGNRGSGGDDEGMSVNKDNDDGSNDKKS